MKNEDSQQNIRFFSYNGLSTHNYWRVCSLHDAKNNLENEIFKHLEAKCCGNMEEGGPEMKSQRSAWARMTDDAEVLIY